MKLNRFASIPVILVFMLLSFVYYVTIFVFIEKLYGLQTVHGSLNALIFSLLEFLCLFSFVISIRTDPGNVPSSYVPDVEESGVASDQRLKQTQCDKCRTYKPPRTHHCRICRKCILRMDHHCIWINNCVGHWNYKSFFTLVFYATVGSIYSMVVIVRSALQMDWDFSEQVYLKLFYIACGILTVSLSLILGTLLGWHIYLISHNMTTIEHYESIRAAWLARKSGRSYYHLFDLSVYRNITLILGPNMLKWLWPTSVSHLKDGTSYPTTTRDS